jgi:hypothetical protein
MFIVKFDSSGYASWALAFTSGGDDNNGIAVGASNSIYVGGDFIPNHFILGSDTLNNITYESSFIAKFGLGSLESISNAKTSDKVSIYPNPTSGIFSLKGDLRFTNYDLRITDVLGQQVYTQAITNPNQTTITVSQLSSGIYFYQLTNGTESCRGKFVKQ